MKIRAELSFVITLLTLFFNNEPKYIMFMLFSAFIHEIGHLTAMKIFKIRVKELVLGLFGGTIVLEKKLISYPKEAILALSGAMVNIVFSALLFLVLRKGFSADIFFLFMSNLFYGVFNLLPVSTLDGGAALLAILSAKKELCDAERIAIAVSKVTLFLLAVFSLSLVAISAFNISLFIVTLLFYAESTEGHIISGYEFCRKTS